MAISAWHFSVIAPKGETARSAAELTEASQAERRRSLFEPVPLKGRPAFGVSKRPVPSTLFVCTYFAGLRLGGMSDTRARQGRFLAEPRRRHAYR